MTGMATVITNRAPGAQHEGRIEWVKEACTMALYVSIVLLAELTAVARHGADEDVKLLRLIWGTDIGLALAHWFAFWLSARLVATGSLRPHDAQAAGAQLSGAAAAALLATVPVVLLPPSAELDVARLVLAGFIGCVGYAVARESGASGWRATLYALSILLVAAAVAIVKNVLGGH
jgi:hypothetical protein